MNINTEGQKALQKRLQEMAKAGKEGFEEAFKDAKLGQGEPNDEQFMMWFGFKAFPLTPTGQVNPGYNPNFIRALPYVDGGKQILRRYERITNPSQPPEADPVDVLIAEAGYA